MPGTVSEKSVRFVPSRTPYNDDDSCRAENLQPGGEVCCGHHKCFFPETPAGRGLHGPPNGDREGTKSGKKRAPLGLADRTGAGMRPLPAAPHADVVQGGQPHGRVCPPIGRQQNLLQLSPWGRLASLASLRGTHNCAKNPTGPHALVDLWMRKKSTAALLRSISRGSLGVRGKHRGVMADPRGQHREHHDPDQVRAPQEQADVPRAQLSGLFGCSRPRPPHGP